jgi:two-component system, cell cycle sensor histidine kinase and response regulator CckA
LSTAYGIVQQSAGFIRLNSHPGSGSEFNVYLPRFTGPPQSKVKEARALVPPGARSTVLLVEDDPSVLALVRTLLTRLGHRVLPAASGQEALRVANEHRERIDLVLTDVVMPGMNGVDLMARLHAQHPNLPCVFMSGYATDVLTQTRADLADVVLLRKPFTIDALAQALQHAERKPGRAAVST